MASNSVGATQRNIYRVMINMKSFLVLYKKRPLFPIMLSLLLLFAVSLNVIGAAMLASAHRQSVGISNEYVKKNKSCIFRRP